MKRLTLAELRGALSQKEVAAKTGLPRQAISGIERGRVNPTSGEVDLLARALGVQPQTVIEAITGQEPLWTRKTA